MLFYTLSESRPSGINAVECALPHFIFDYELTILLHCSRLLKRT